MCGHTDCGVTSAVLDTLATIRVDAKHYIGCSMWRAGISAGLAAHVPERIRFLQSGHCTTCEALSRNHVGQRNPTFSTKKLPGFPCDWEALVQVLH